MERNQTLLFDPRIINKELQYYHPEKMEESMELIRNWIKNQEVIMTLSEKE
ncbi:hypothetical protein ACPOM7_18390 [Peribacillus castrilensis]|uniref:Uncharacterized protein n=1 Tax=Peribacillus simplex TaxID=1478 RepID=A0AAN2PIL6_9BACI|nr:MULTISPECIES: hypothetical protein [Bacillaceae]MCF7621993.1 hypothetical protein [Peribacillus frigoritolerans]MCP1156122.1 hypothetical protein [Peribacillus frigoritolerans]MCT1390710.1 hypothetical protein [Peribacillus frigoritolerans]CEG33242.1 hypothetical protein BN1180_03414 [Peribacillus simplex]